MKLDVQKRLAAKVLGISEKRVKINLDVLDNLGITVDDFKQSITKADIRGYINKGVITSAQKKGVSRGRARKIHTQKVKGRQRGVGTRKGSLNARMPKKTTWMNKIRAQRELISELREKGIIENKDFWELYSKAKGGFFRSRRHVKIYAEEHDMLKKKTE